MTTKFSILNANQRIANPDGTPTREFFQLLSNFFNATNGGTLGSAAFQDIGSSGGNVPLLNGTNEWSGPQKFDSGEFILKGSSTGTTEIVPAANAAGVITVPPATDVLVGRQTVDTLVNKTLQSPVVAGTASGSGVLPLAMLTPAVSVGEFPATATNDSANAGYVGEFISSTVTSGAGVTLTASTAVNITSTSLTAGNWLVAGNIGYTISGGNTFSNLQAWTSTTSATTPATPSAGTVVVVGPSFGTGTTIPTGIQRLTLTASTTVYLTAFSAFSAGSATGYGYFLAWRPR